MIGREDELCWWDGQDRKQTTNFLNIFHDKSKKDAKRKKKTEKKNRGFVVVVVVRRSTSRPLPVRKSEMGKNSRTFFAAASLVCV